MASVILGALVLGVGVDATAGPAGTYTGTFSKEFDLASNFGGDITITVDASGAASCDFVPKSGGFGALAIGQVDSAENIFCMISTAGFSGHAPVALIGKLDASKTTFDGGWVSSGSDWGSGSFTAKLKPGN